MITDLPIEILEKILTYEETPFNRIAGTPVMHTIELFYKNRPELRDLCYRLYCEEKHTHSAYRVYGTYLDCFYTKDPGEINKIPLFAFIKDLPGIIIAGKFCRLLWQNVIPDKGEKIIIHIREKEAFYPLCIFLKEAGCELMKHTFIDFIFVIKTDYLGYKIIIEFKTLNYDFHYTHSLGASYLKFFMQSGLLKATPDAVLSLTKKEAVVMNFTRSHYYDDLDPEFRILNIENSRNNYYYYYNVGNISAFESDYNIGMDVDHKKFTCPVEYCFSTRNTKIIDIDEFYKCKIDYFDNLLCCEFVILVNLKVKRIIVPKTEEDEGNEEDEEEDYDFKYLGFVTQDEKVLKIIKFVKNVIRISEKEYVINTGCLEEVEELPEDYEIRKFIIRKNKTIEW